MKDEEGVVDGNLGPLNMKRTWNEGYGEEGVVWSASNIAAAKMEIVRR